MTRHCLQNLMLALVLTFLASCVPVLTRAPAECSQIIDEPVLELGFDQVNQESFATWVSATFKLPPDQIVVEKRYNEDSPKAGRSPLTETIKWEVNGKLYYADFVGSDLRRLEVQWESFAPMADDVIRCWGAPESYVAYRVLAGRPLLDFQLWYPAQGVVVRRLAPERSENPRLTKNIRMQYAVLTRPAPPQQMMSDVLIGNSTEIQLETLGVLKPWPGSWEETSVDVDPLLQK